jgi:hypothetical protein
LYLDERLRPVTIKLHARKPRIEHPDAMYHVMSREIAVRYFPG